MAWRRIYRGLTLLALLAASPAARAEELLVSAAASLTNAFREIGAAFEKTAPGVRVTFNFSASGPLLQQIENGAPVDVFASADQESMDAGEAKKLFIPATRRNFASNRLVLIQPKGAVASLRMLAGLRQPAVKRIAIGNPASVPVGRYAREALLEAKLWEPLFPRFINADSVRQALDYVARGEVDAGFVYATDAAIAKEKVTVAIYVATKQRVLYPVAVVAASKHAVLARCFADFLVGDTGQALLAKYGFGRP